MRSPIAETNGARADPVTPEYCRCETLVLGCGNDLFGDDGFGPAVVQRLRRRGDLPESVLAIDVGTSAREVLFNVVLSPVKPRSILVVDAVDLGRKAGEVWVIEAGDLPAVKCDDFSMHQLPTSNLLRELSELGGVNVACVVGQVDGLPAEVRPGLSAPLEGAVERAVEMILQACRRPKPPAVSDGGQTGPVDRH